MYDVHLNTVEWTTVVLRSHAFSWVHSRTLTRYHSTRYSYQPRAPKISTRWNLEHTKLSTTTCRTQEKNGARRTQCPTIELFETIAECNTHRNSLNFVRVAFPVEWLQAAPTANGEHEVDWGFDLQGDTLRVAKHSPWLLAYLLPHVLLGWHVAWVGMLYLKCHAVKPTTWRKYR